MNRHAVQLILVAALVAIAGCVGGMGETPESDSPTDDSSVTDSSDGTGTAAFYVSDEPNVIDDFEHLNVTITKIGFKKTGEVSGDDANETDGDDSESESDYGNESTDETATDDADGENETDSEERDGDEAAEGEENGGEDETEEKDDGGNDGEWIEYDVDERTVDLTELKGANASMIDEFELPAGEYETVFIYVSDTEGVLTDGTTTRVKLPSNKLQLHTTFTVGNNQSVDFVYDIAPHKAGKSGKYILEPVISQSGTGDDVKIHNVDEKNDKGKDGKQRGNGNADEERAKAT